MLTKNARECHFYLNKLNPKHFLFTKLSMPVHHLKNYKKALEDYSNLILGIKVYKSVKIPVYILVEVSNGYILTVYSDRIYNGIHGIFK